MSTRAKNRPKRIPLHKRKILELPKREGYRRRFVNEEYGKVQAYLEAGWTLIEGDSKDTSDVTKYGTNVGSVIRVVVNRDRNASAKTAVAMEIPEDIYLEAQAEKQREVDESEASYDPAVRAQLGADYGEMKRN